MAFKRPSGKPAEKNLRVKNSYYTFSKEYPVGIIGGKRKSTRKKDLQKKALKIAAVLLCFVCLSLAFFFIFDLGLKFSLKQPQNRTDVPAVSENVSAEIKALYMPKEKLSDAKYIKRLIRKVKKYDANGVVIDFKDSDGYLAFSSKNETALLSKAMMFDNTTAKNAIALFHGAGISVTARVFCFEDPIAAEKFPELAVKYQSSDVNFLEKPAEEGGKPRLNPFSERARGYVLGVTGEIAALGVNSFILDGISFPDGDAADAAGYPGEKKNSDGSALLLSFAKEIKDALPKNCTVRFAMTATDALHGNEQKYRGQAAKNGTDGVCAYTESRPDGYELNKENDFAAMVSMFGEIETKSGGKAPMLWIGRGEYSKKYRSALEDAGCYSFVVFDENGEY